MNLTDLYYLAKNHSEYSDFEIEVKQKLLKTPSTAMPPECEVFIGLKINNEITFDVFGLIPAGLAIDKTKI